MTQLAVRLALSLSLGRENLRLPEAFKQTYLTPGFRNNQRLVQSTSKALDWKLLLRTLVIWIECLCTGTRPRLVFFILVSVEMFYHFHSLAPAETVC